MNGDKFDVLEYILNIQTVSIVICVLKVGLTSIEIPCVIQGSSLCHISHCFYLVKSCNAKTLRRTFHSDRHAYFIFLLPGLV